MFCVPCHHTGRCGGCRLYFKHRTDPVLVSNLRWIRLANGSWGVSTIKRGGGGGSLKIPRAI